MSRKAKDNNVSNQCFAHRHMTPQEFGVYEYIGAVTRDSGVFYMDGESLAAEFEGRQSRLFYKIVDSLTAKGWLSLLKKPARTKQGTFAPAQYKRVSHSDWIVRYPDQCRMRPVAPECNGPLHPDSQPLHYSASTVAPECNKVCKEKVCKEKPNPPTPQPKSGTVEGSLQNPSGKQTGIVRKDANPLFDTFEDNTPVIIPGDTRDKLCEMADSVESLRGGLILLENRDQGWEGLKNPLAVVIKEFASYVEKAKRQTIRQRKESQAVQTAIATASEDYQRQEIERLAQKAEADAQAASFHEMMMSGSAA